MAPRQPQESYQSETDTWTVALLLET
jgi:hypothetical protein